MICLLSDFFSNNIVPIKKCGNGLNNSNNNMGGAALHWLIFFILTLLSHCNYFMTVVNMNFIMNKTLAGV